MLQQRCSYISREPKSAVLYRYSTLGYLSRALNIHYMAHGLICTSLLRLTLKSKNNYFSYNLALNSHFLVHFLYDFFFFLSWLHALLKSRCKQYVFLQQRTTVGVKAIPFCALSVTKAPPEHRGTKLSVHIKLTWHNSQNTLHSNKNEALSAR